MITLDIQLLSSAFDTHWFLCLLLIVFALYEMHLKHELLLKGIEFFMILAQMILIWLLSFYYNKQNK